MIENCNLTIVFLLWIFFFVIVFLSLIQSFIKLVKCIRISGSHEVSSVVQDNKDNVYLLVGLNMYIPLSKLTAYNNDLL